ncbi:glucose-fructose oxidoreductase [Robiginitalea myxolifaciens]|uniref:Glucose-fructose oxidoreductase n=1 Tax=Robiginitalea myxolifaciens TaxID=400055 RepID=A0A1I6GVJ0_9FLAO|nr:Gfo/Idh/MocA family oxidoreductase [Robiginitalea myxolifaciens]SFR46208.1 glucose-fructose oxidoreductase [Robiginitalea myxolifaciens]
MGGITRRSFSKKVSRGAASMALLGHLPLSCSGRIAGTADQKLGVALVGLGSYSTYQLAPALQDTEHCYLAGIVTGTPAKARTWQAKYNLDPEHCYSYETYDQIAQDDAIAIVYVVLPNSMHAEFAIRAAQAGKHVICEKPMGMNVAECDAIIAACQEAGVKLGMGYRLQSEPYTQEIKKYVREKTFGAVRFVSADAAYISRGNPNQWRLDRSLSGGGALMNMGVYSIQSCIYSCGMNPLTVSAQEFSTRPEYFRDTDETITAQFTFPNGVVGQMMTSHNASANRLYGSCDSGWFELQPANNYGPLSGRTSSGSISFPHESQQKLQMDDFASHILYDTPNRAPGEMGKRDMIIVEAIYQSIKEGGREITLNLPQEYGIVTAQ